MNFLVYIIEHRLESLIEILVPDGEFSIEGITFSRWNPSFAGAMTERFWVAKGVEQGKFFREAFKYFKLKLIRIVPRLSLIGQAYIEFTSEPFLVSKEDSQQAFLKYFINRNAVSLNLMNNDIKALNILLKKSNIPDEFYYYWNDAVNTSGYAPKLLAMFSAIEVLVKTHTKIKSFLS